MNVVLKVERGVKQSEEQNIIIPSQVGIQDLHNFQFTLRSLNWKYQGSLAKNMDRSIMMPKHVMTKSFQTVQQCQVGYMASMIKL
jgi:hypothetical protein